MKKPLDMVSCPREPTQNRRERERAILSSDRASRNPARKANIALQRHEQYSSQRENKPH
ncbi:MAG: hypothetical protein QM681_08200 [Novosphingobium sp.]